MNLGPETEILEHKKTTGELKEAVVSLASMLNKNGYGTLYFGVSNNGEVIGQQIGDSTLRDVSQGIANHLKPQVIPTIRLELMDGKNVIKVDAHGTDFPYSAYGKYYMRSADEDRELSPRQLRELMLKKSETDIIAKTAAWEQNLSFQQLKVFFVANGLSVNEEAFETNLGLKLPDGKYNIMAGLLADKNDISIKVVTFAGKDKSKVIRRNEYGYKCLITAMDQVITYMESINDTYVELEPHGRKEEKLFDMKSFREAWINACLHTKWERMNPPAVYIFRDRIEIISTGGLPEDLSKEEFFRGVSRPVNGKLQKIFGQLGFVEQTGHGIPLIIENYGKQAFEVMDNYINVTIPFSRTFVTEKSVPDVHIELNDSQSKVYRLLQMHERYTINQLVEATGLSDGYIRKILTELKAAGRLERIGSKKKGYWSVR